MAQVQLGSEGPLLLELDLESLCYQKGSPGVVFRGV